MLDTYGVIWNQVKMYCPAAGPFLAQHWVTRSFREVAERRRWSWLFRYAEFLIPAVYKTGTVTVTRGSATVAGAGTVWTSGMVGRQFRTGGSTPIYTVKTFTNAGSIDLDLPWGGADGAGLSYEIWQAYVTPAADFHAFVVLWDPALNWRLYTNAFTQKNLDSWDAQRSNSGNAYVVVPLDYDTSSPPLPRYELWPHQKAQYVYPYLYEARPADLGDAGAQLPRYIRGDVLLEMALEKAALWPGPSVDEPNPYFSVGLAREHRARAERMVMELERQDDEVNSQDFDYASSLPLAPFPDARWLQSHAEVFVTA